MSLFFATLALAQYDELFAEYKAQHGRVYGSLAEEKQRLGIFKENMKRAAELEKVHPKASFGATVFADMTPEEFKVYHRENVKPSTEGKRIFPRVAVEANKTKDWRVEGAVTKVKDQGQCGSCWAFSITGAIEGAWATSGRPLVSVSEQFFVSCDTSGALGCNGGLPSQGLAWDSTTEHGKVPTEASYPYTSGEGEVEKCKQSGWTVGAHVTGYANITASSDAVLGALETAPVSVAVQAEQWQLYVGGVFGPDCGDGNIDHGVLLVGYTPEYWIVKNSWSTGWGVNGYIYLSREGDGNTCKVLDIVTLAHTLNKTLA